VVTTLAHTSATGLVVDALMPEAVLPVDLAVNAEGTVAVLSAGRNQVVISRGGSSRLMGQPTSIVAQPGGFAVFEREPAAMAFLSSLGEVQLEFPLPGASVASTGHALFHQATDANLACASCHPEGGEDGHVWNFDTGARRTQTLRGGLSMTAPFHWTGDEADMQSLVTDVMSGRMSGHQQTPQRTQALLSWLDAQPALEAPPTNAAAVARGEVLFASSAVGCAACHTGALGTNNQTLNVGTDGMFQVPRLVELGWRTKWFHDGRVKTANERFGPEGGGDAHGTVSALSAQDKADLIEYLRSR
jgi:mono/diheme cytochrome c family protein/cytochrome c553